MTDRVLAEVFPPGDFIREELEARGWKQADLAEILGRPIPVINGILSGKTGITPETARGLAGAFGTSAELWMNLDSGYQLSQLKESNGAVARRARIYEKAPVREMIKRRWIEPSNRVEVLEQQLLTFYGIERLEDEPQLWPHEARKSASYEGITVPLRAWLVRVRQMAEAVHAKSFSIGNVMGALAELRPLLETAEEARRVPAILGDAGIRFMVVEPLTKSRIDGACLWLDAKSPVVALSLRYDRIDAFWYTLMHELAHVSNRDGLIKNAPVDVDLMATSGVADKPEFEIEADKFAASSLIDSTELEDFILRVRPLYSRDRIRGFADRLRIHPGIVVGQLQFRGEISYAHSRQLLEPIRRRIIGSALTDGWGHEPSGARR